jgi:hypothetical protein
MRIEDIDATLCPGVFRGRIYILPLESVWLTKMIDE